jgi:hypothetical protein
MARYLDIEKGWEDLVGGALDSKSDSETIWEAYLKTSTYFFYSTAVIYETDVHSKFYQKPEKIIRIEL